MKKKITPVKQTKSRSYPGHLISGLIILSFSFLLYGNTLSHKYAQDDAIVIHGNKFTTQGIRGIPSILKYDTFFGFFNEEGKAKLVSGGRYRPLSLISFALEWELFGSKPFIGHMLNVLFYGLLGLVLYLVVIQLRISDNQSLIVLPVLVTAIYMAHPIHTEVVANIKGRDEIFCMLFSMIALLSTLKYLDSDKIKWGLTAGICLFLGCLSKENAVCFMVVIPLSLWIFRKAKLKKVIIYSLPVFVGTIIFLVIRTFVLGFDFGGHPSEMMNNPFIKVVDSRYMPFSFHEKYATILYTLGKYIQLLFFPHPLTHDYYPRHIDIMTFKSPETILSALMYLMMLAIAWKGVQRKEKSTFAILFYLITLSIVSNIVFPIGTNMSERFMFMPSFGFCLLTGIWFESLILKSNWRYLGIALVIIILSLFSLKTISRNTVWKNDYTLFTSDISISKNSAKLRNAVGGVLSDKAVKEQDEKKRMAMLNEAIENLEGAIKIHPNYKNAHLIMGNCYFYLKDYVSAEIYYQNALNLDPDFQDAVSNLAVNDRELGRYYGSQVGDLDKALSHLTRAYSVLSEDYETLRLLGIVYGYLKQHESAIASFKKALEIAPESAEANANLAKAYANANELELSNQYFNIALQIDPDVLR